MLFNSFKRTLEIKILIKALLAIWAGGFSRQRALYQSSLEGKNLSKRTKHCSQEVIEIQYQGSLSAGCMGAEFCFLDFRFKSKILYNQLQKFIHLICLSDPQKMVLIYVAFACLTCGVGLGKISSYIYKIPIPKRFLNLKINAKTAGIQCVKFMGEFLCFLGFLFQLHTL